MSARLAEYVQHKPTCAVWHCVHCGFRRFWHDPTEDLDEQTCIQRGLAFTAKPETECTCGLADALRSGETPPAVVGPLSAIRRQIELRKKVLVEDEWPQLETTGGLSFAKGRLFELEMVLDILAVEPRADHAGEAGDRRSDLLRQIDQLPRLRQPVLEKLEDRADFDYQCTGHTEYIKLADVRRVLAETPPLSLADRLQVGIQATDEIAERLTKFAAPPRAPQEPT